MVILLLTSVKDVCNNKLICHINVIISDEFLGEIAQLILVVFVLREFNSFSLA